MDQKFYKSKDNLKGFICEDSKTKALLRFKKYLRSVRCPYIGIVEETDINGIYWCDFI